MEETRTIPIVFTLVADPVWQLLRRKLVAARRQRDRFHPHREFAWGASGWSSSRRLRRTSPGSHCCSTRQRQRSFRIISPPSELPLRLSASRRLSRLLINEMSELQSRFATQTSEPKNGLVVIPDAFTQHHLVEIAGLAARYRVPAINWSRSFTEVGGLISYGPYLFEEFRRAASYV
jgi:putative ABC transport system substrate-binding protein